MVATAIVITALSAILCALSEMNIRPVTRPPRYHLDDFDHWMSLTPRGDCGLPAASAGGEPTSHPITLPTVRP